jgi:hypothetical protein
MGEETPVALVMFKPSVPVPLPVLAVTVHVAVGAAPTGLTVVIAGKASQPGVHHREIARARVCVLNRPEEDRHDKQGKYWQKNGGQKNEILFFIFLPAIFLPTDRFRPVSGNAGIGVWFRFARR